MKILSQVYDPTAQTIIAQFLPKNPVVQKIFKQEYPQGAVINWNNISAILQRNTTLQVIKRELLNQIIRLLIYENIRNGGDLMQTVRDMFAPQQLKRTREASKELATMPELEQISQRQKYINEQQKQLNEEKERLFEWYKEDTNSG